MDEKINEKYEKLSEIENYKQINEDFESGKTFLIDYKNSLESNKFGFPLTKFYPNVTGQLSYKSRINKNLIKDLKYETPQYLPNTPHLVGSSMCPRPLSIPFVNLKEKSEKIINNIKKEEIFNKLKNKNVFNLEKPMKDSKALPSYFCVKLGADSPKTRKYLIKMFDEEIQNKKKEYNNDPKYFLKDSSLIGLSNYKTYLQNNLTKNRFNGNKIPYTKQVDIYNKFKITKRLIKKEGWNKMHLERQNINHEVYTKLYQIRNVGDKNNIFKRNFSNIDSFENKTGEENYNFISKEFEKDKSSEINNNNNSYYVKINKENNTKILNALITPRDEDINHKTTKIKNKKSRQKIIYDKYPSFQNNLNKSNNKFGSTITTCFNYNNESQLSKNIIPNKKELYSPKLLHNFRRSLSNFISQKKNLEKNNDDNNNEDIRENIKDEKLSNISYSQEVYHYQKRIRKLNDIKENCEHENKLIKGYQSSPESEEFEEITKKRPPRFMSPISVYKKEIEMFKKVNPIEYERQLKKKLFDDKMLMKKLQNKKIYERIKIKK